LLHHRLHLLTAFWLVEEAASKSATYGSLGLAAAPLFALHLVGRLIVAAAVLNAALWNRRGLDPGGAIS